MKENDLKQICSIVSSKLHTYEPTVYVFRVIGSLSGYVRNGCGSIIFAYSERQAEFLKSTFCKPEEVEIIKLNEKN